MAVARPMPLPLQQSDIENELVRAFTDRTSDDHRFSGLAKLWVGWLMALYVSLCHVATGDENGGCIVKDKLEGREAEVTITALYDERAHRSQIPCGGSSRVVIPQLMARICILWGYLLRWSL